MSQFVAIFTPEAQEQLVSLYQYIANVTSPNIASNYVNAIAEYCESLKKTFHKKVTIVMMFAQDCELPTTKNMLWLLLQSNAIAFQSLVFFMAVKITNQIWNLILMTSNYWSKFNRQAIMRCWNDLRKKLVPQAKNDPQQPLSYSKSDSKEWRLIFCLVTPMRAHYLDGSTFRNSKDGVAWNWLAVLPE